MEAKNTGTFDRGRSLLRIALVTAAILLIPLVGGFPWTTGDYVVMGGLIFGAGLIYEFLVRRVRDSQRRTFFAIALFMMFLLVWAELAVGIFGSPFAGS